MPALTIEQIAQAAGIKAATNLRSWETIAPTQINRGIAGIIYADPGVGKTTLASTLPVGDTLIISVESGVGPLLGTGHRVVPVKDIMVKNNINIEMVMNTLYRQIRTKEVLVGNVVIDNMSELIKCVLHHFTEMRKKEFPEIKEHGDTAYKIMEWLSNWRDLTDMGINVIFNAWETQLDIQNSDGTIITKTCPDLGKSSTLRACGLVDIVGHLEVFEKTGKRWLRFGPAKQYLTKCQFKGIVTTDNPSGAQEPDLSEVISKIKGFNYAN